MTAGPTVGETDDGSRDVPVGLRRSAHSVVESGRERKTSVFIPSRRYTGRRSI